MPRRIQVPLFWSEGVIRGVELHLGHDALVDMLKNGEKRQAPHADRNLFFPLNAWLIIRMTDHGQSDLCGTDGIKPNNKTENRLEQVCHVAQELMTSPNRDAFMEIEG